MFVVTRYKKRTLNIIETVYTPRETTDPLKNLQAHSRFNKAWIKYTFSYNLKTTKRLASAAKTT